MKTKLILAHIFLLGLVSQAGICQTDCNCSGKINAQVGPYLAGELFTPSVPPDIITYFNREWLIGDITLADGGIMRNRKIRYNCLLDELLYFEAETNKIFKLDKEAILQFHFHNFRGDTSVYFRILKIRRNIFNDSVEVFVQHLYREKLSLYVLHSFYFDRREVVRINDRLTLKDIYKEEPVYYLGFENNNIVEFKNFSRKSLYAFFTDKRDQIRKYLRESSTGRIKTTPEILSFVQFISSVIDNK